MSVIAWIDVAEMAYLAGFRGDPHAIIVALTQPESGRNPEAQNKQVFAADPLPGWSVEVARQKRDPNTGLYWVSGDPNGGSFGLIQENGIHDPRKTGGPFPFWKPTAEWIESRKDPQTSMNSAFRIWTDNGKTFNPWGAFTSKLHEPFLPIAKVALDGRSRVAKVAAQLATCATARSELQARLSASEEVNASLTSEAEKLRAEEERLRAEAEAAAAKLVLSEKQVAGYLDAIGKADSHLVLAHEALAPTNP